MSKLKINIIIVLSVYVGISVIIFIFYLLNDKGEPDYIYHYISDKYNLTIKIFPTGSPNAFLTTSYFDLIVIDNTTGRSFSRNEKFNAIEGIFEFDEKSIVIKTPWDINKDTILINCQPSIPNVIESDSCIYVFSVGPHYEEKWLYDGKLTMIRKKIDKNSKKYQFELTFLNNKTGVVSKEIIRESNLKGIQDYWMPYSKDNNCIKLEVYFSNDTQNDTIRFNY